MKFIKDLDKKGNKTITIALVLGILIVANFISYSLFVRLDLTENKDYSISKVSKKTVGDLEDLLNVKVYFSKNLPPKYLNLEKEIADILNEYESYSNGKIKISYIDPKSLENADVVLSKEGIPALQFNVMKNDSYEAITGFMGISMQYGSRKEVIPVLDSSENLEYRITSLIKKLTEERKMTIGLVVSNGAKEMIDQAEQAKEALSDLYNVKDIDLEKENGDFSGVDTLVVIGVREKLSENELKKIDKYILSDRPILLAVDGVVIDKEEGPKKNEIGLGDMLMKYGLKLNNNLIADVSNSKASIPTGFFNVVMDYPFWPKVIRENFNKENAMVASLESVTLPWASSIEIAKDNLLSNANVLTLVSSTDKACADDSKFDVNPQAKTTECSNPGQHSLAVYLNGEVKSFFEENKTGQAKIILVGDSDFATDQFLAQDSDNLTFFQNMVDGLTMDEDLINIRSKAITERPINKIDQSLKEFIRYFNIFGITVIVLLFGLLRYFLRRKSRFSDDI